MKYITPVLIFLIIAFSMLKENSVYNDFTDGAKEGLYILKDIFPPIAAIITASAMLKASGALDMTLSFIAPITDKLKIPSEVMPLVIVRPISGSGAMGILAGILNDYGADSYIGRLASIICGSTETTFYCLAVYFSKTRVKYIKRAVPCAVLGDLTGIAAAVFALKILKL